jgi:hypothetical protein
MKKSLLFVKALLFLLPIIAYITHYNLRMEKERYKPHIYTLTGGKVLVAQITGDPDVTLDTAATTLYSAGRKLKLSPCYMSGRHLNWKQRETIPRKEWVVHYARVVPETAVGFADIENPAEKGIYYERREETEIAEILHLGRYEEIPHSLLKLRRFIEHQGYRIVSFYEEVYLVFDPIEPNPGKYETSRRYEATKR